MTDPLNAYLELLNRVDDFTRRVGERYPGMLQCRPGCDDCCQRDLSLFPIEVKRLTEGARKLSAGQQARVLTRARATLEDPEGPCPLLEEGHCLVYEVRPVICRSHGLPLLLPDQASLSLCPHNFKGVLDIQGDCVLDLNPVNQILATVNLLKAEGESQSPERLAVGRALVQVLTEGGAS